MLPGDEGRGHQVGLRRRRLYRRCHWYVCEERVREGEKGKMTRVAEDSSNLFQSRCLSHIYLYLPSVFSLPPFQAST